MKLAVSAWSAKFRFTEVSCKKYFGFLLVWIAFHGSMKAQDSLSFDTLVPEHAIKFSPLHLINFYPTIEVSYERKIAKRITLQFEVGYLLDYGSDLYSDFHNKRGVKLKLEGRHYFWGRIDRRKLYYVSVEPYMNIVNFDREDMRQECFDLECNHIYTRQYFYTMEYREQGVSVKLGLLRYMFRSNFMFDLNSGFTLRVVRYKEPANLVGGFGDDDWTFLNIPNETDRVTISPNLGIRLGYRFR